jgi:hypothetical protein
MPRRLSFKIGMEHVERWGVDAPTGMMKDGEVVMYHAADAAYPDGAWDSSLVRLHQIPNQLTKGWVGELPEGKVDRDAAIGEVIPPLVFDELTIAELEAYADVNEIDLSRSGRRVKRKADIVAVLEAARA